MADKPRCGAMYDGTFWTPGPCREVVDHNEVPHVDTCEWGGSTYVDAHEAHAHHVDVFGRTWREAL